MEPAAQELDTPKSVSEDVVAAPTAPAAHDADLVESELLIEELSIDGMCGVY